MENSAGPNFASFLFSFAADASQMRLFCVRHFFFFIHHTNPISPNVGAEEQIKKNH